MDFNSLFAQFAPQLLGGADAAPGGVPFIPGSGGPAPAAPMPAGMGTPLPMAGSAPAPMKRSGLDNLTDIAPLLLSAFTAMKDPAAAGALLQGVARGQAVTRAQQLETQKHEDERKQLAANYMQRVAADAQQFDTVEEHQKYLAYAEKVGESFGIQPGQLTTTIAFPKTKQAAKKRAEAQARLQALESNAGYKDIIGTPQESGLRVTMPDGESLTVAELRQRSGLALTDQSGKQVVPTAKPTGLTDYDAFLARFARERGKTVEALTTADEVAARQQWAGASRSPGTTTDYGDFLVRYAKQIGKPVEALTARDEVEARKAWGQADDRARVTPPAGTLPPATQRRVDMLAKGFDSQKAVQRAVTMAEAADFATGLQPNTTNPADDQALIYAFAKVMDPESVVREGEYATVQKHAQSWAEQFGFDVKRIFTNTTFLTAQARANLKATILSKFGASRTQYDNLRRSYAEKINRVTRQGDGADYLTDYGGAFPGGPADTDLGRTQPTPAPAPAGKQQIGRFQVEVKGGK